MDTKDPGSAALMEKWKKFERVVAALHAAEQRGAEIKWNDHIAGRQFDVTVRFKQGPYQYLTAVECRDLAGRVEVSDVEAFVTKARDAKVDKAVMVSAKGFQSGAVDVAEKHGVLLFTLDQIDDVPPETLSTAVIPIARVHSIELQLTARRWLLLPEDRNLPQYLARHLTITTDGTTENLNDAITRSDVMQALTATEQTGRLRFGTGATAFLPHLRETKAVRGLRFKALLDTMKIIPTAFDPHILKGYYEYRNVATAEVTRIPKGAVQQGFDTVLESGRFYFNPNLEFSYFCEQIGEGVATLVLVESYQHGELLQARYTQKVTFQTQFLEITDAAEIARLKKVGASILSAGQGKQKGIS